MLIWSSNEELMKLKYYHREFYGRDFWYADCEKSKLLSKVVGRKTINVSQLKILAEMGYQLEFSYAPWFQMDSDYNLTKSED